MKTRPFDDAAFTHSCALLCFHRARRRFLALPSNPDEMDVFGTLTEALWWTTAVDEGFEDLDGDGYKSEREAEWLGRHLVGLRHARNQAGHQRAFMVRSEGGLTFPVTFPLTIPPMRVVWRPVEELPPPSPDHDGKIAKARREQYATLLVGRPVAESLNHAAAWFAHAQNREGTVSKGIPEYDGS